MTTRTLTLLVCVLCMSMPLHAQVVLPEREMSGSLRQNVFGLGLAAGPASGLGLSFRHHLPTTFSYQITGGIIKVDERLQYAIGGEVQFDLSRSASARFFALGAAGYYYAGSSDRNDMAAPGRAGVGLGGEIYAGAGFHANLELVFTYFSDGTVLPLPQFGLFYYF